MTIEETVDLLTVAAAYDRRTVGEGDAIAWHAAIGHLPLDDAAPPSSATTPTAPTGSCPATSASASRRCETRASPAASRPPASRTGRRPGPLQGRTESADQADRGRPQHEPRHRGAGREG